MNWSDSQDDKILDGKVGVQINIPLQHKVASSNTSLFEPHSGFYRLLLMFMHCDLLAKNCNQILLGTQHKQVIFVSECYQAKKPGIYCQIQICKGVGAFFYVHVDTG